LLVTVASFSSIALTNAASGTLTLNPSSGYSGTLVQVTGISNTNPPFVNGDNGCFVDSRGMGMSQWCYLTNQQLVNASFVVGPAPAGTYMIAIVGLPYYDTPFGSAVFTIISPTTITTVSVITETSWSYSFTATTSTFTSSQVVASTSSSTTTTTNLMTSFTTSTTTSVFPQTAVVTSTVATSIVPQTVVVPNYVTVITSLTTTLTSFLSSLTTAKSTTFKTTTATTITIIQHATTQLISVNATSTLNGTLPAEPSINLGLFRIPEWSPWLIGIALLGFSIGKRLEQRRSLRPKATETEDLSPRERNE